MKFKLVTALLGTMHAIHRINKSKRT